VPSFHFRTRSVYRCHQKFKLAFLKFLAKYVSIHNSEFMFQHTLMNIPFHDLAELFPPHFDDIPEILQSYAVAEFRISALLHDDIALTEMLRRHSLKSHKISTYFLLFMP